MEFKDIVYKRRTIRRFKPIEVPLDILKKVVDYGRLAPCGMNVNPIEYIIVKNKRYCDEIFPNLKFSGGLPPEMRVPEEGRRPMAYIIILGNTEIKNNNGWKHDVGACVENILLGLVDEGLGGCWMGSINKKKIQKILKVPKKYEISHVITIGYPDEESILEPLREGCNYWKDEEGKMHVPRKSLEQAIFDIKE